MSVATTSPSCVAALAGAALLLSVGTAWCTSPLGRIGAFKSIVPLKCDAGPQAQFRGDCDPPQVNDDLSLQDRVQAHLLRAEKLVRLFRSQQARADADAALRLDPTNMAALKFRARLLISLMDNRGAARDLETGLQLSPQDPDLLGTYAELLFGEDKLRDALRDASAALAVRADDVETLILRARILMRQKSFEAAEQDLDRALATEPDAEAPRLLRAQLLLQTQKPEAAIDDADKVLARRAGDPSALEVRAYAHIALGDSGAAIEDISKLIGKPGQPTTASPAMTPFSKFFVQRAILLARVGNKADARKDLEAVLASGGTRAVLRLQVMMRRLGFPDIPIDGKRNDAFDEALMACVINEACGRGIANPI
ncbi:MAG: tetratricopeptide repeat protein [Variibacter sp.]